MSEQRIDDGGPAFPVEVTDRQILQEDIDWLLTMPRSLERDRILHLLRYEHANAEKRIEEELARANAALSEVTP